MVLMVITGNTLGVGLALGEGEKEEGDICGGSILLRDVKGRRKDDSFVSGRMKVIATRMLQQEWV